MTLKFTANIACSFVAHILLHICCTNSADMHHNVNAPKLKFAVSFTFFNYLYFLPNGFVL